jgi:hypothetical protein
MPKWLQRTLIGLALVLLVLALVVGIYVQPLLAGNLALEAMKGSATVTVTDEATQIVFAPKAASSKGLIFYQGAKVAPEAYSVALLEIAAAGYTVFVPKMPLNFAVLGSGAAKAIMDAHPEISAWALAGHSLGGAMACSYASGDPRVRVLIFWAAYCDQSFDLSGNVSIAVTSISGALDGLATPAKVDATKVFAPLSTTYIRIPGMNHAQFGDYGAQSGDNPATLSATDATRRVVAATLAALGKLAAK